LITRANRAEREAVSGLKVRRKQENFAWAEEEEEEKEEEEEEELLMQ
jgi:hypothetical protein